MYADDMLLYNQVADVEEIAAKLSQTVEKVAKLLNYEPCLQEIMSVYIVIHK